MIYQRKYIVKYLFEITSWVFEE